MQAYRTALGSTGTTMLLSPSSEFFNYFEQDAKGGVAPPPAQPGGIAPLPSSQLSVPDVPDVDVETDITDSPLPVETTPAVPVVESPAPAETPATPSSEASSEPVVAQ
jgi:membrane protease subunit HflC